MHTFFLLLLGASISFATLTGGTGGRGIVLWLLLVLAVAVREIARAVAAAYWGLEIRSILLLPTGGLTTYASSESTDAAGTTGMQKRMGVVGPIANILFGLVLAGLILSMTPGIAVFGRPWVTPGHLLRAAVWVNLLLGVVNLLPASPLDGGRVFQGEFAKTRGVLRGRKAATGVGQIVAVGLMVGGLLLGNVWLIMMGAFVLIGSHMETQSLLAEGGADTVTMADVMLMTYSTISASDTLEDALDRSIHTMQDVFPVVRGGNIVGAVSRQGIVEALAADGNGYVQGVMTRTLEVARPGDSLVKTLRRVMGGSGVQMLPVVEGDLVVGIITPQHLAQSMGMLGHKRRSESGAHGSRRRDRD